VKPPSPILEALANRYTRSIAGRSGETGRDVWLDIEELLRDANSVEGDSRAVAEQQLRDAEQAGILKLEPLHKRDRASLHQVRFSPACEARLFDFLGRSSPTSARAALAQQFAHAAARELPERWRDRWTAWCERMRVAALAGKSVEPLDRQPTKVNEELLALLPRLLGWEGESLVRFASCVLCGDSKTLESLAARDRDGEFRDKLRGKLGRIVEEITGGQIRSLDELGIVPNPRFGLIHGPMKLQLEGEWLDLGRLKGAFRLAEEDIRRAESVATSARRCLTVENETSFHELAKLHSGELLVQTSFPGSGTLSLLSRLPDTMEFWHFGDCDEAGFEILRVLREKSGRDFRPLHMQPGRVPFEQESLGRPTRKTWPFYD
jgi:hypothetical protein